MQQYELMLMLPPNLGEKAMGETTGEVKEFIKSSGGKISQEDVWGIRDLAYRIKKHDQAYYSVWLMEMPGDRVSEMENMLNIHPNVLRYLLIKTPKFYQFNTLAQIEAENAKQEEEAQKTSKEESAEKKESAPKPKAAKKSAPKEDLDAKLASIIDDPDINL